MYSNEQLQILLQCPLFKKMTQDELAALLPCLMPTIKSYQEDDIIFLQDSLVSYIYIILNGQVEVTKANLMGQKNIIALLGPSKIFGEGIVCTHARHSPVTATAVKPTSVLCIPYERIIGGCEHGCSFHHDLIHNMMLLLGEKNYLLNIKMDLLLIKGMREKLTAYLLLEAKRANSPSFTISLNRNQLADYLNVSRPSMSRELARMKEEGLIDFYQNSFKLIKLSEGN